MRLPNLIVVFLLLAGSAAEASYIELPVWRGLWHADATGAARTQGPRFDPWHTDQDGRILINLGRGAGVRMQLNAAAATTKNTRQQTHRAVPILQAPSAKAVIAATASVLSFP
ncbi:MAG: hypothetical protein ACR2PZ_15245 [Pseudomonadales bacterium]